ncbi:MAG: choice-of-anchor D domain-containing protein [bacterium]|nr:choice-of-anchor D domain-containing protein [bacterium]
MKPLALLALSVSLFLAILFGGASNLPRAAVFPSHASAHSSLPPAAVCFAPGTPPEYMAEWQARMEGWGYLDYRIAERWGRTATNNQTGSRGTPITLTYSFVPDGIDVYDGAPNVLFARMNALFGSPAVWQAKFAQAFQDWSRLSGLRYVQVSDDGAVYPDSRGVTGARGDVRIAAAPIDGQWNILAMDYYPDYGDMLLDSDENWAAPAQNYIFLRNIVRHEHGHGIGLAHVCPANSTKLLEPYYSSAFDGPQHDDIRGAQRNYGDRYEDNDNAATATRLGTVAGDTAFAPLSLDGSNDADFYKFAIPAGQGFTLVLSPDGRQYREGQLVGEECGEDALINSLDDLNLDLQLYNASGSTLLAESAAHPAGEAEQIYHYMVPLAGDSFMAKITGTGTNEVQLYTLQFSLFNLDEPYLTVCPVNFDSVALGSQVTRNTRIVNPAAVSLNIFSMSLDGPFTVEPSAPQTIPSHDSLTLTVRYSADTTGYHSGTLSISHSGPGGQLTCEVSATAVASWLQFVLSRNVDFGDVPLGTTDSARVPIRAQGNLPLTIQSVMAYPSFSLELSLPLTLQPLEALVLWPRFTPAALGLAEGILLIYHSGVGSPDTMFLRGTCVPGSADDQPDALPVAFRVSQNYPNPFNAATRISFDLPHVTRVAVQVYDVQGRLVREMAARALEAGRHSLVFDGSGLSSGVYLYRVVSPEWSGTGKMMLLK